MSSSLYTISELPAESEEFSDSPLPEGDGAYDTFPLSFSQNRLWFLDQWESGNAAYNIRIAVRMNGELNLTALERSLNEVIRRHESLRTIFTLVEGQPAQVIAPDLHLTLTLTDLTHLPADQREAAARAEVTAAAQRPFDLSTGPLLRAGLVRIEDKEHVLLLVMHHIISDGWSLGVLFRELTALYEGYTRGEESGLPELPIQYADYAVWQREWLQGEVLEEQLSYWRTQLAGAPAVLELPTDRPRPPVQSYRGAREAFAIPQTLTTRLKELSRQEDVTLFMTLLAAWQTLLYRYSGQEDIIVGSPVAGRNRAEVEHLIGFFVNTLVLRTRVSGERSFGELLKQVREVCLGGYTHQEVPFEKLVEELQPERSQSHNPLFQVLFQLQDAPLQALQLPGLTLVPVMPETDTAKFDLALSFLHTSDGLSGWLEYNTDLFNPHTIERLIAHYGRLLESVAADPQQKLSEIALLNAEERHQLLVEWNDTRADFPADICVHELFEAQATRTPDAVAVVYEDQQLTYRELNERANQLAHHLRELGVGAETLVGLCVERSLEMMVGLLGILKAGGAYLPLDPSYPQERLSFMLEDASVAVLVTERELSGTLAGQVREVVYVDEAQWPEARGEMQPYVRSVGAENLCYVIYTSGSTGKPKGVMLPHRAVVNFLCSMRRTPGLTEKDVLVAVTTLSFDIAGLELFLPLSVGARVVLVSRETASDGAQLARTLARTKATLMQATPATWQLLVEAGWDGEQGLKALCGGEALRRDLADSLVRRSRQLWNMFGPTETTIWSTVQEIDGGEEAISIGRPIANTQTYILDERLRVVPVGVSGELYIGGEGLARGYLNRPELAAERFVPNPFSAQGGERMYRTGDLARFLADGKLEYLARVDQQVKVRGFRIELGEVETILGRHPDLRACAVSVYEDGSGAKSLVGYIVTQPDASVSSDELHTYLRERLPDYMSPTVFVSLEALPLTPNGKVNRRALPAPDISRRALSNVYVAPRNAVEAVLAGIWSEVLRVESVGVRDNFFTLGGHSLLATQVISRIRNAFKVELPLRAFFDAPSVAAQAESIHRLRTAKDQCPPSSIVRTSRDRHPPLSFSQQRLWFLDQLGPGGSAYNIRIAVRMNGELNLTALERSLNEVTRRHESLRTTFTMSDGQPVQVISPDLHFTLTLTDLTHLPADQREAAARAEVTAAAQRPFDLSTGPLLRAGLVRMDEQEHVLLLVMHHIISDGWSLGVLFRELTALYEGYTRGEESQLEELAIQYADYAVWQREWLQGEVLDEQLGYWREQLAGAPAVLELPTDRPRPPVAQNNWGRPVYINLSAELTNSLKGLSRQEDATLFMTLLAAWQILLYRYSGQEDIVVGSPIAGRNHAEVEALIGFFVNTLVLRARLKPHMEFRELLGQVREVCLGAYAHQDVPFERLVEELHPERGRGHNPVFQVLFQLQGAATESLRLSGLKLSPVAAEGGMVNLDLSMSVREGAEGLSATLRYNTELFDDHRARALAAHYERLLESIVADPQQKLSEIALLGAKERQQLLIEWNDTQTAFPADKCIHELFGAQVARTPNAIAVVYEDQQLTYGELNERANRLAHHLRELGVGAESLVGLCVERSIEMIVGLLGVLKAGGAYLPLDPSYPQERLRFMLDDARVSVLLTQQSLVETLPAYDAKVLTLDADWPLLSAYSAENPTPLGCSDNLCYVIYTSGSTGRPKGVMTSHRALVNYVEFAARSFSMVAADRVLQFASINFDTSAEEIFPCLTRGASLVLRDDLMLGSARAFFRKCEEQSVTLLDLPTSYWHELAASLDADALSIPESLRLVIIGGEKALRQRVDVWQQHASPRVRLINTYGPTEATIVATTYEATPEQQANFRDIPIGRPVANARTYVLDRQLRPTPVGVPGELYVGGAGLARGYLRRPELTAEKFVADPFSDVPGARLYRTGDLCRHLPGGELEYLGRTDEQVKIRGFRIELGEIEAALLQHEGVRECAVVAREDEPGEKRVVAYLVAEPGAASSLSPNELRGYLGERLPVYMQPGVFVLLEALPLTPNGKIDRRALPAPDKARLEQNDNFVSPRTPVEKELAEIWRMLLNVERVGIQDNFFTLGGHSLLLTQMASRIQQSFGVELTLRALFAAPTIVALTTLITAQQLEQNEIDEAAQMLDELSQLSPEEVRALLEAEEYQA